MADDKKVLDFKSAGMRQADNRDQQASKGKQFGIGNFFGWAMKKYPTLTLGQMEQKMPSLEREYAQEKTMRKKKYHPPTLKKLLLWNLLISKQQQGPK